MTLITNNKDRKYTDKLNQKFYYVKDTDSIEKINKELEKFFLDIITGRQLRDKNSKDIDGLQAVMVLRHTDCVGKICETKSNYHGITLINCYEYLGNKKKYSLIEDYNLALKEYMIQNENSIRVRIDTSRNELIIIIDSNKVFSNRDFNDFQLSIIHRIYLFCKTCKNRGWIGSVYFGINSPNIEYRTRSCDDDFYKIISDNKIKKPKSK
ncbi:MAG: hypothetical protein VZS44_02390 [Bacilli bacterium]|nr:hypothetical protein [Bacilli bacterium]